MPAFGVRVELEAPVPVDGEPRVDAEFGDPHTHGCIGPVDLDSPDHPAVGGHGEPCVPEERFRDEDEVDRPGEPAEVPPVRPHRRDPVAFAPVVDLDDERVLPR